MQLGLENFLRNKKLLKSLKNKRVALLGHPASVDHKLNHSLALLKEVLGKDLACAFGPQHGMRGEKQDNMIESEDYQDPIFQIPIFSLYGEVRRPTKKMLDAFDVLLVDLQDVGCRIYTFLTTLFYLMDDCARANKTLWVLDRPNPAGRPVEGNLLKKEFFSFVGAAEIPMRHGLTLGEAGLWYKAHKKLEIEYRVIPMTGYKMNLKGEWGWPENDLSWVNPSPNMPQVSTARMYAGTVLIEGSSLSEGRGTTRPLELFGAPDTDGERLIKEIYKIGWKPSRGVRLRSCYFEPTFQKHAKKLCGGFQIHIDQKDYAHNEFKPYRLICAAFKAYKNLYPERDLWILPPYEYERINMPIDILSGDSFLREWVHDKAARFSDLNAYLLRDEKAWLKESREYFLY
jgi:uncharacterized protein YbbC (DUF1343 family)